MTGLVLAMALAASAPTDHKPCDKGTEWVEMQVGHRLMGGCRGDGDWSGAFVLYLGLTTESGVFRSGQYRAGDLDGEWHQFYPSGKIHMHGGWNRGRRVGMWAAFHENGTKAHEGFFVDGKPVGAWIAWNEAGQRIEEAVYQGGVVQVTVFEKDESTRVPAEVGSWSPDPFLGFCQRQTRRLRRDFAALATGCESNNQCALFPAGLGLGGTSVFVVDTKMDLARDAHARALAAYRAAACGFRASDSERPEPARLTGLCVSRMCALSRHGDVVKAWESFVTTTSP